MEWPCEECEYNLEYVCSGQEYCERIKEYEAAKGLPIGES